MLEINILPVLFALFQVMILVCWWEMKTQTGRTQKPRILRFWLRSAVECTSSTLVSQFHKKKSVHVIRMKSGDPQWTSVLPQKQMEKSCVTRTFSSQPLLWDTQYQYETSEIVVQTLFINSNYWKQLTSTFMRLFLEKHNEKWTMWHSDWWEKNEDFVRHCTF